MPGIKLQPDKAAYNFFHRILVARYFVRPNRVIERYVCDFCSGTTFFVKSGLGSDKITLQSSNLQLSDGNTVFRKPFLQALHLFYNLC